MFLMRIKGYFSNKIMALSYWGGPHRSILNGVVATLVLEAPATKNLRAEIELSKMEIDGWIDALTQARASIENYEAREQGKPDPWVSCAVCSTPMKSDDPVVVRTPAPENETFCHAHSPYK